MLATHSGPSGKVANFPPEQVANFSPEWVANFPPESMAKLPRNMQWCRGTEFNRRHADFQSCIRAL